MNDKFLKEIEQQEQRKSQEKATLEHVLEVCNQIQERNKSIEAHFSRFKRLSFEIEEKDRERVEELLKAVKLVPNKFEITRRERIHYSEASKRFLAYYVITSFLIVAGALWFGIHAYYHEYKPKIKSKEQQEWLINYYKYMREKNPTTHNTFITNNPPP